MDILNNVVLGFSVCADPTVLLYCAIGVLAGIIIGALPGLGPAAGIAVLLPITYGMNPVAGIVMLCGIFYGAMYGGSISSILINTPGDGAAVMTTIDGYPLARKGKVSDAMGMALWASLCGGVSGAVAFMFLAPILARFALLFGAAEYFALMILGLSAVAGLTGNNMFKGFLAAFLGLFLSTIGVDLILGMPRFAFGIAAVYDGVDFIPVAMGLFGIAEIISPKLGNAKIEVTKEDLKFSKMFPSKENWTLSLPHIVRGTVLGFFVGVLPGAGGTIATFLSYDMAKRTAKPERRALFGTGIVEGVAAPESSNNAAAMGSILPMLTLGIPGSSSTAIMMGALIMFGMTPGPFLFEKNPEFAWGLIASLFIGNLMMLILATFCMPAFIRIIKVRTPILNAIVMGCILIGAYALSSSMFDVYTAVIFGAIGFFFRKLEISPAPLVISLILGEITERKLRQAMTIARGDFWKVITQPIALVIYAIAIIIIFGGPVMKFVKGQLKKHKAQTAR